MIWDTVVRLTDDVGTAEAKATRLVLRLILNGATVSWKRNIKGCAASLGSQPDSGPPTLPPATKGLPLFVFLHDTPANAGNLLPVFLAAQKRGWRPNVLLGDGMDLRNRGLANATTSVSLSNLKALATTREWLAAVSGA